MRRIPNTVSGLAVIAMLSGCSGPGSSPIDSALNPNTPTNPMTEAQPKEGKFSVKENHNHDLGRYVSGENNAAIFCNLVSAPNSALGKFINIEALWTWQNPDKAEQNFYRVHIEAQSPRDILPGKNNFDFIDAQVRLYRSKLRQAALSDFMVLPQEAYGCDVANLEKVGQKLRGRISCYKNNVYHAYNFRINFECAL